MGTLLRYKVYDKSAVTPPVISAVSSGTPGSTTATITWTTDKLSTSTVNYGLTTDYGSTVTVAALVTSHSVPLTDLGPGTAYYFSVSSTDAQGNTSLPSGGYVFTTATSSTVNKILDNGPTANHIDLVFVSSGYTSAEMATYRTYCADALAKLLTINWFSTNQTMLNVWRIDQPSTQSGVDFSDADIITYASVVEYDYIIACHNKIGGEWTTDPIVHLYKSSETYTVIGHELGHLIGSYAGGGLCDEYYSSGTCTGLSKMCMNVHDKNSNEKWSDLIATAPVQGARYCPTTLWRPSATSIMFNTWDSVTFDAVGLKAMDMGAGKICGTIADDPPTVTVSGVTQSEVKSGTFTVTVTATGVGTATIERVEFYWALAGATSKSVQISRTAPYTYQVVTTNYTDGSYFLDVLVYDSNWNYSRRTIQFAIANSTLSIPLRLREVAGVARVDDVVSSGVPLAMGTASVTTTLAVYNPSGTAIPAQFKVLERWNAYGEDNSIKWLLVTFLATATASATTTYTLRLGSNPAPAVPATIVDNGTYFTMNGANYQKDCSAPFVISLKNSAGTTYTATQLNSDNALAWSVEESGPVRTCLKVESQNWQYEPTGGYSKFGFIAWIYAYAGLTRVDVKLVLKNNPKRTSTPQQGQPFYLKDFSIAWAKTGTIAAFGGDPPALPSAQVPASTYTATLAGSDTAYVFQEGNGYATWQSLCSHSPASSYQGYGAYDAQGVGSASGPWTNGIPSIQGYKYVVAGAQQATGLKSCGYAALDTNCVLVRDFWQNHPNCLEVSRTAITAHLLTEKWTCYGGLHWLDDLQRKAWDLSFRTSWASTDSAAFDYPLVIYCGLAWNKVAKPTGYISKDYVEVTTPVPTWVSQDRKFPYPWEYNWIHYGATFNDYERRRYHWYKMDDFLHKGDPYCAYETIQAMRHTATIDPSYVDNYSYPADSTLLIQGTYMAPYRSTGTYSGLTNHHGYMPPNAQHACLFDLVDGYKLTGDPLALDAFQKLGVHWRFYVDWRKTHNISETRQDAWPLRCLCQLWRITEDAGVLASLIDYIDNVQYPKINKTYGYYALNTEFDAVINYQDGLRDSVFEQPMMMSMFMDALAEAYEILSPVTHTVTRQHVYDMIILMTDFVVNYGYTFKTVGGLSGGTAWVHIPWDAASPPGTDYQTVKTWEEQQGPGLGNTAYMVGGYMRGYGGSPIAQMTRPTAWCYRNASDATKQGYRTVFLGLVDGSRRNNTFLDTPAGYDRTGTFTRGAYYTDDWGPLCDDVYENG